MRGRVPPEPRAIQRSSCTCQRESSDSWRPAVSPKNLRSHRRLVLLAVFPCARRRESLVAFRIARYHAGREHLSKSVPNWSSRSFLSELEIRPRAFRRRGGGARSGRLLFVFFRCSLDRRRGARSVARFTSDAPANDLAVRLVSSSCRCCLPRQHRGARRQAECSHNRDSNR
jgi:hypothetical protein